MKKYLLLLLFITTVTVHAQVTFQKTFGRVNDDGGNSVRQTTDGGYIIVGTTLSFGTGSYDIYLIKTDNSGDTLWTKTYGGINNDVGYSVQQTADGGYIVTGETNSFGAGNDDAYLIKTDANGDTLWTKTYGGLGYEGGKYARQTMKVGILLPRLPKASAQAAGMFI